MNFDVLDSRVSALGYRFLEASAGTGKTFAIEHLVLRWILEGIALREILVVTFTKAATQELIKRIYTRLQLAKKNLQDEESLAKLNRALASYDEAKIMTIHGFCQSMLSKFFFEAKCSFSFSKKESCLWQMWLDFLRSSTFDQTFSAEEVGLFFGSEFEKKIHELVRQWQPCKEPCSDSQERLMAAFTAYRKERADKVATPEELLLAMHESLANQEFLQAVQKQFSAVVIDEFQDTDRTQWEIFSKLFLPPVIGETRSETQSIKAFCVVGDPKQSIYAFRRADLYTYFEAKQHFAADEIATLGVNYRSEEPLVEALNALFTRFGKENWMQLPKWNRWIEILPVVAGKQQRESSSIEASLRVVIAKEKEEDLFNHIARVTCFWVNQGIRPSDIAILVKSRYEARALLSFLQKRGIGAHYTVTGQLSDTATFEAIFDFIALLEKPKDRVRLKRVLASHLLGWPIEKIEKGDFDQAIFGLDYLLDVLEKRGFAACLEEFYHSSWEGPYSIAERLLQRADIDSYEEFQQIADLLTGIEDLLHARLFLINLREKRKLELEEGEKRARNHEESIQITTIFQSKGLEYEIVFPLGLATHRQKKEEDQEIIAEKMRLFYVALTRAKRCVYLPWLQQAKEEKPSITEQFFAFGEGEILDRIKALPNVSIEYAEGFWDEQEPICKTKTIQVPLPEKFTKSYAERRQTSFSSIAKDQTWLQEPLPVEARDDPLPLGASTGKEVHAILEKIFKNGWHNPYNEEEIRKHTRKELFEKINGVFLAEILPIVKSKPSFTLKEVARKNLFAEVEFIYEKKGDLIKGFIDLIFFHEGLYYIIDWKTNWLLEYSQEAIELSVMSHRYDLQAQIYTEALERYVKLFDERPFPEIFGGAHYLYLRGMQWKSFAC